MLEVIYEKTAPEEDCLYLPDRRATIRYRVIDHCTVETCERLLARGWRRFGRVFFRPVCAACEECRSLRIDVERFRPSRSMRRAEKRNRDLRVVLRRAAVSRRHLDLYNRYHADMSARKGWTEKSITASEYRFTFVEGGGAFGHEIAYFEGERLRAVALVDLLPRAISAVYCYYDPACRERSLGTFSILRQVALARSRRVPYVYLGYLVVGNESMRYKSGYRPHEILSGRPGFGEEPRWKKSA